ncbi:pectate lyase [Colletotrichum graminicola]|uniref:pectin lyase n=1 Tax=Colletotrichum graminicola (strain M1.001 / M2 / FGSC 10212) TaxID=645133 RepID=E3QK15_COLGM|nr:pectate lyase [Colletotrichum graminicola M1.001]EFQ31203.1 pectate lyase [Colletotrichum graminicola M1.001]WDK10529.1 pectate lyase [Colletotrichum graminicola]
MKSAILSMALAALAPLALAADAVQGSPEGFAKGTTGGGSAAPVYPSTTAQLVSYLTDSSPRVIVLTKTFDFRNTEGTTSGTGCAPWGTGSACQTAINKDNWCTNYQPSAPKTNVKYDNAGLNPVKVSSNKSIIGQGNKGVIIGKGLRITGGAKNIIIQNIHITNLNPQYVWGGDAITLDGSDLVWIDHVTTSLIGRQHIVLGNGASNRVTISNSKIDGATSWSATCDGHHYWGLYFTGSNDLVTFKGNYITAGSGRSPKVGGNSLVHLVNNYWYDNTGHALEADAGAKVVAEGNVFQNVKATYQTGLAGKVFASPSSSANTACKQYLGHDCQVNAFGSSGSLAGSDTSILSSFSGKNVASAGDANSAKAAANNAGFGKI